MLQNRICVFVKYVEYVIIENNWGGKLLKFGSFLWAVSLGAMFPFFPFAFLNSFQLSIMNVC